MTEYIKTHTQPNRCIHITLRKFIMSEYKKDEQIHITQGVCKKEKIYTLLREFVFSECKNINKHTPTCPSTPASPPCPSAPLLSSPLLSTTSRPSPPGCIRFYVCVYVCVCVCESVPFGCVRLYLFVCVCVYKCSPSGCMCLSVSVFVCACVCACACASVCVFARK